MAITITSREFNQHASRVLKMAEKEPVFITKWGKIVSVVSSYVDYRQKNEESLASAFSKPHAVADVDDDFDSILESIRRNTKLRITELE